MPASSKFTAAGTFARKGRQRDKVKRDRDETAPKGLHSRQHSGVTRKDLVSSKAEARQIEKDTKAAATHKEKDTKAAGTQIEKDAIEGEEGLHS